MRILLTILTLLSTMGIMAQNFTTLGDFKSDTSGKSVHDAWMELSLTTDKDDYKILRLMILPEREAEVSASLVDTVWFSGSKYREDPAVKTDVYVERDIFFLYTFDKSDRLESYYVFSRFVDTSQDNFTQIVVRKFDAAGKRLWCMTANSTPDRAKEFFSILSEARKKLKFKKTTTMKGDGRDKPEYWEPKVKQPSNTIGRGSAYGTGW